MIRVRAERNTVSDVMTVDGYNITQAARQAYLFIKRHWPPAQDADSYFADAATDMCNTMDANLTADGEWSPYLWTLITASMWILEAEWRRRYDGLTADELYLETMKLTPDEAAGSRGKNGHKQTEEPTEDEQHTVETAV